MSEQDSPMGKNPFEKKKSHDFLKGIAVIGGSLLLSAGIIKTEHHFLGYDKHAKTTLEGPSPVPKAETGNVEILPNNQRTLEQARQHAQQLIEKLKEEYDSGKESSVKALANWNAKYVLTPKNGGDKIEIYSPMLEPKVEGQADKDIRKNFLVGFTNDRLDATAFDPDQYDITGGEQYEKVGQGTTVVTLQIDKGGLYADVDAALEGFKIAEFAVLK